MSDVLKIVMWIAIGGILGQAFQTSMSTYVCLSIIASCLLLLYLGRLISDFKRKRKKKLAAKAKASEFYDSMQEGKRKAKRR